MKYTITKGQTTILESVVYTNNGLATANLTSASVSFMVKKNVADLDAEALITKSVGSGIVITDAVNGVLQITLNASDTNDLSYQSLFFEILVKLSNGTYIRTGMEELIINRNLIKTLI
jgi:hypothetical protein